MPDNLLLLPIVTTIVFLILAGFIVSFSILFQRRQLENLQEKQSLKLHYEQATLQSQIEIQNQTLQNVGQELHDNVGQLLTVVKLYLNSLEEENHQADLDEYIKQSNDATILAIQSVRSLSKSLDGFGLKEYGLLEGISQELNRIGHAKKIITKLNSEGEPYPLNANNEIIIFRIVQEILNNAIKHSQASLITVFIGYSPSKFVLALSDDGIGFDYPQMALGLDKHTGLGLQNIKRRVALMGGELTFRSQKGEGTRVQIEVILSP